MNTARKLTLLALLLTGVGTSTVWAQEAPTTELPAKVLSLQERDPAGFIMTFTAVLVVFSALVMLVFVFKLLGRYFQSAGSKPKTQPTTVSQPSTSAKPSGEALVAISLALQQSLGGQPDEVAAVISLALRSELEQQHDQESYVLTIRRQPTQWNARIQGTQRYNH